ncbi:MAG TPA: PaaI family thioesterase [Spongiibacteraceae bacterium]|nr:thioesterase [Spongiibacteraceae bacterium]MBN51850.1 thioesterase [Spongiibacteraceae bacterium]HCS27495.1 PaaI family thioesterase [Spongiibacteraceae bacterium]|tara:strand:- start:279 stop:980 length:702 start_codon:yes stop_codon:yes gene_type:complete
MQEELFNPFLSEEVAPANSKLWEAKRRVADAIRQLNEVLVTSTPPVDELHDIAEQLEITAAKFGRHPRLYGRFAFTEAGQGNYGEIFHELNPLSGRSNPVAPPLNMWQDGEMARASVTMGWRYEGPPGSVHGGFVAALFDDFLGMAQMMGNQPGMTGTLTVKYRRPTPLETPLALSAWVDKTDGRKTFVHGKIEAGGSVTAECECIFIRPKEDMGKLREAVMERNRLVSGEQD